jgi:A-macroglobulin receptor binding domain
LTNIYTFQRVETKDLDTVLIVYYYSIGATEICLGAEAVKTSNVALLKPAPVRVYDYYDSSKFQMTKWWYEITNILFEFLAKRARKFYDVSSLNGPSG